MNKRRIVITGMGTINAVGHDVDETWKNLLAGKSGVDHIKNFEITEEYTSRIAGEIKNYDPIEHFDRKRIKKMDHYTQYALISARQAFKDSGLDNTDFDHDRAGVIVSSGIGGMLTFETEAYKMERKGPKRISPFFIPKMISNIASAEIAIEFNLRAINFNISSACASANHSIGTAFRSIQYGDADIMLTGGAEGSVTPLAVAGFCSMRALSTRNDEPQKACRPFDKERDGFVMGEGSGMLLLESYDHAKARGAKIYCEILGTGMTADAYHMTAPHPEGLGASRAMEAALKEAQLKPDQIDYINTHGTATGLGDIAETKAIKDVLGKHAYEIPCNSTKSMSGHLLGAAGAIEAIVTIKSINESVVHPTINLDYPDPECDLDYVPNKKREATINYALSNSFGFGGHNSCLVVGKI